MRIQVFVQKKNASKCIKMHKNVCGHKPHAFWAQTTHIPAVRAKVVRARGDLWNLPGLVAPDDLFMWDAIQTKASTQLNLLLEYSITRHYSAVLKTLLLLSE